MELVKNNNNKLIKKDNERCYQRGREYFERAVDIEDELLDMVSENKSSNGHCERCCEILWEIKCDIAFWAVLIWSALNFIFIGVTVFKDSEVPSFILDLAYLTSVSLPACLHFMRRKK